MQAQWEIATGYFPANQKTSDDPTWKAFLALNPRITTFVDELRYAVARPSIAALARISSALSNQLTAAAMRQATPKAARDAAAQKAQPVLDTSK